MRRFREEGRRCSREKNRGQKRIQEIEKGREEDYQEREEGVEEENTEEMKEEVKDEVLEVIAKHWEELQRRDDAVVLDIEIEGDMGSCELSIFGIYVRK